MEQQRETLQRRLGDPARLRFPEGWTTSSCWHRAQAAPAYSGPVSPGEFEVLLGYPDRDEFGDTHRVLFAIYEGELRAECDCRAFTFDQWCSHVAYLWWRWVRSDLGVVDLDTGRTHLSPPCWLTLVDEDHHDPVEGRAGRAAADGGVSR